MSAPRVASSSALVAADGRVASRSKVDTDTLWSLAHGVGFLVVAMAMVFGQVPARLVSAARQQGRRQHLGQKVLSFSVTT